MIIKPAVLALAAMAATALTACGSSTASPAPSGTVAVNQTGQTSSATPTPSLTVGGANVVAKYHCNAGDGMLPEDGTLTLRSGMWVAQKAGSTATLPVGTDLDHLAMPARCHVVK